MALLDSLLKERDAHPTDTAFAEHLQVEQTAWHRFRANPQANAPQIWAGVIRRYPLLVGDVLADITQKNPPKPVVVRPKRKPGRPRKERAL